MSQTSRPGEPPVAERTVEQVVRQQLGKALGGTRGMLEAAVPTIAFTVLFLTTRALVLSVVLSGVAALALLAVRLVQRSTPQFALNSVVGIAIGAFFAYRSAAGGGDASDQALAYFLPGILYNAAYAVVLSATVLVRWPVVGFLVGSVAGGDPTAWHRDRHVVALCSRLTWLLVLPCLVRVVVQGPMWLAGRNGWWDDGAAIAALGVPKIVMGWPLQVAALLGMLWLLTRNRTPISEGEPVPQLGPAGEAS